MINERLKNINVFDRLQKSAVTKLREINADYSSFIIDYIELMKSKKAYSMSINSINRLVDTFVNGHYASFIDGSIKLMSGIKENCKSALKHIKRINSDQKNKINGLEKTLRKIQKKSGNFINAFKKATKKELAPNFSEKFKAWIALKKGDTSLLDNYKKELVNIKMDNNSIDSEKYNELKKLNNDFDFVSSLSNELNDLYKLMGDLRNIRINDRLEQAILVKLNDILAYVTGFVINYSALIYSKTSNDITIIGIISTIDSISNLENCDDTTDFVMSITGLCTLMSSMSETIIDNVKEESPDIKDDKKKSGSIHLIEAYLNKIIQMSENLINDISKYSVRSRKSSFVDKLTSFLTLKLARSNLEGSLKYQITNNPIKEKPTSAEQEKMHYLFKNIGSNKNTTISDNQKRMFEQFNKQQSDNKKYQDNIRKEMRDAITPKRMEFVKASPVSKNWSAVTNKNNMSKK